MTRAIARPLTAGRPDSVLRAPRDARDSMLPRHHRRNAEQLQHNCRDENRMWTATRTPRDQARQAAGEQNRGQMTDETGALLDSGDGGPDHRRGGEPERVCETVLTLGSRM